MCAGELSVGSIEPGATWSRNRSGPPAVNRKGGLGGHYNNASARVAEHQAGTILTLQNPF